MQVLDWRKQSDLKEEIERRSGGGYHCCQSAPDSVACGRDDVENEVDELSDEMATRMSSYSLRLSRIHPPTPFQRLAWMVEHMYWYSLHY